MVTDLIAGLCGMSLLAVERAESAEPLPTFQASATLAVERLTGPDFRIRDGARQRGIGTSTHLTRRNWLYQGAGVR